MVVTRVVPPIKNNFTGVVTIAVIIFVPPSRNTPGTLTLNGHKNLLLKRSLGHCALKTNTPNGCKKILKSKCCLPSNRHGVSSADFFEHYNFNINTQVDGTGGEE
jgi:hypothetical protein